MSLTRLVYASRSKLAPPERAQEIERIIASARRLNAENGVTGFLMVTPAGFAQVLEGEQDNIAETYGRIVVDPRHADVRVLLEEPIVERAFQHWSMGVAEQDETTMFIFGLYGVAPETDLTEQPADALLDLATELANRPA